MLEIKLTRECLSCPYVDVYVDQGETFSYGSELVRIYGKIGCKHERVCKMYEADKAICRETPNG